MKIKRHFYIFYFLIKNVKVNNEAQIYFIEMDLRKEVFMTGCFSRHDILYMVYHVIFFGIRLKSKD